MLLVLVFAGIFLAVLGALAGSALVTNRAQTFSYQQAEARTIAEAGINYYKWYLEQNPANTTQPEPSATIYTTLGGHTIGSYTLSIAPDTGCPGSGAFAISSVGSPSDAPSLHATVSMLYVPPSATYAFPPDCTATPSSDLPQFLNWREN